MAKNKILIGSVLKPVDDVRHYHKLAKSILFDENEIHIFGYTSKNKPAEATVFFHNSLPFFRISLTRLFKPLAFFLLALRLKPALIICGTHELLAVSIFTKWLLGCNVIYDVRENYYANIVYTDTFPPILRHIVAYIVRCNEYFYSVFTDYFILAEQCYGYELPFLKKGKYTVIENKFTPIITKESDNRPPRLRHFMITGTLGLHYGTKEGIAFFKQLKAHQPDCTLTVSGVVRHKSLLPLLKEESIDNQASQQPVAPEHIQSIIAKGGIALCPYQPNRSTENRIPTKFYEYLYYRIPMIVQKNEAWETFLSPYRAAIFIDFSNFDPAEILQQLQSTSFYSGVPVGNEICWAAEREKLVTIDLIKELHNA